MSDKILEGIFPRSAQNLSFELFQRLLALGYYIVLKVCGHVIEAAIDLAATVLYKLLQQHGHEFRD